MRKATLSLAAIAVLLGAATLFAVTIPRGPMGHGWDWPWHDWYHSRPADGSVAGAWHSDAADPNSRMGERIEAGSDPAVSQEKGGMVPHAPLLDTLLPDMKDLQVAVYEAEYAPGGINPRHLHPAAITFYVVSGTGVWQEEGKPPVTLHAGDSLFVPAGTIHSHWNPSATEPLRFLEFIVSEKGKGRSIPMPTQK